MILRITGTLVFVLGVLLSLPGCRLPTSEPAHGNSATRSSEPRDDSEVVLFFGDSMTRGKRIDRDKAYPALIQRQIRARGWSYRVVNASRDGDTTGEALGRLDAALRHPLGVIVVALGINDQRHEVPVEMTEQNLDRIIERSRRAHPDITIILAGIRGAPGVRYSSPPEFEAIYPRVAARHRAALIPDWLAGMAGVENRTLPDGLHPNVRGHIRIAENVWKVLEPILAARRKVGAESAAPDASESPPVSR